MPHRENYLPACFLLLLTACGNGGSGGGSDAPPAPATNTAPVANAGLDQIVLAGAEVTLDAGLSFDAEGDSLTYLWSIQSEPDSSSATIIGAGKSIAFMVNMVGNYEVGLMVNDGVLDSAMDIVNVDAIADRNLLSDGTSGGLWPNYAGNLSANKYSPLDQINRDNFGDLRVIWRWRSPDNNISGPQNAVFEATPLMIDGVLYTSTSFSQVIAINAETGQTLWTYDSGAYNYGTPPNNGFLHRGVTYSERDGRKQLYIATGDARLIALNPVNGVPVGSFGRLGNGVVDLLEGIPRSMPSAWIRPMTNPVYLLSRESESRSETLHLLLFAGVF